MALIQRLVENTRKYKDGFTYSGIDTCSCDICSCTFEQRICITARRRSGKISNGRDLCVSCVKMENTKHIVKVGTIALNNRSKEDRIKHAKIGGDASSKSTKVNSGRFSTEKWDAMTPEYQHLQVTRASAGLQLKLQDPIYDTQHYAKVYAQSQIGYMSKTHIELHGLIEKYGFKSHIQIGSMQVDECNEELMLVVEYNGDTWHCNPKTWKCDQYNTAIRMTAGEKWNKDIARKHMLHKFGYTLIVIWESGWTENAKKYLDRIEELYNEAERKKRNTY